MFVPVRLSQYALRATVVAVMAVNLVACGGGGGGDDDDAKPTGKISLGGVVSKGLTANANVRILKVSNSGVVNESDVLATGQTNASGVYETGPFTAPSVYVVEVSAKDCPDLTSGVGCSTHLDESTGQKQVLPSGFKMRSVVATTPDSRRINVTAITEWAFAMASSSTNGITPTQVAKAVANVSSIVGVADINTIEPKPLASASTPDEKRVAALLAAVSGLANSDASTLTTLGCDQGTQAGSPQATQCVVQSLAVNTNGTKPVGNNAAVSALLANELQQVVAGDASLATLTAATQEKLTNPDANYAQPLTTDVYEAIRKFFNDLTTTIKSLFDNTTGTANQAAKQFKAAVEAADVDLSAADRTLSMATQGMRLWIEFAESNSQLPTRNFRGFYCSLLSDMKPETDQVVAPNASAADVKGVRCIQDLTTFEVLNPYTDNGDGTYTVTIRRPAHWFEMVKDVSANKYAYESGNGFAVLDVKRSITTGQEISVTVVDTSCPSGAVDCSNFHATGTVEAQSVGGSLSSIHVKGDAPDAWIWDAATGPELKNGNDAQNFAKTAMDFSGQTTNPYSGSPISVNNSDFVLNFSGTAVVKAKDGITEVAQAVFGMGSQVKVIGNEGVYAKYVLTYQKPGQFKIDGVFTVNRSKNVNYSSDLVGFDGKLYEGSSTVSFLSGQLTADVRHPAGYNADLPYSQENYEEILWNVAVTTTAPASPKMKVLLSSNGRITSDTSGWIPTASQSAFTGNYQVFGTSDSNTPVRDVTITGSVNTSGDVTQVAFSDSSFGLSAIYTPNIRQVPIYVNGVERGLIEELAVTLKNGESFSLDLGVEPVW